MTLGIIGAMDEEITFLKEKMTDRQEHKIANCLFIKGKLQGCEAVLTKSGIGKVNAAMATTILHEVFRPSHVINTGSAGGFAEDLNVGDIVISTNVVHHDVDVTAFGYAHGQVPGLPAMYAASTDLVAKAGQAAGESKIIFREGMIATGDAFMEDPEAVASTRERFPTMLAAEMEAAAVAQVCFHYETPFVIIRALSDIAGKDSSVSFDEFLETAAENATDFIMAFVRTL